MRLDDQSKGIHHVKTYKKIWTKKNIFDENLNRNKILFNTIQTSFLLSKSVQPDLQPDSIKNIKERSNILHATNTQI